MIEEEWRPVAGYQGIYEVSNRGLVRSVPRRVYGGRHCGSGSKQLQGRVLRPKLTNRGYLQVVLSVRGVHKMALVHRLVAHAFCANEGMRPNVNHLDGCQTNNHFTNLEWCTQMANVHHAIAMGRTPNNRHQGA